MRVDLDQPGNHRLVRGVDRRGVVAAAMRRHRRDAVAFDDDVNVALHASRCAVPRRPAWTIVFPLDRPAPDATYFGGAAVQVSFASTSRTTRRAATSTSFIPVSVW